MNARLLQGVLLSMGLCCFLLPAQAQSLKNNPFVRPALVAVQAPAMQPSGAARNSAAAQEWKPELRAILVSGSNSIVNVDGTVLPIGGQINGYRLVEVHDESAVFAGYGKRIRLSLQGYPPLAAESREPRGK